MSQPDASSTAPPPPQGDWRDQRRQQRMARRAERHAAGGGWAGLPIGGLFLLILGIGFLLQKAGYQLPERWWALLLLVPAVASLVGALRAYQARSGGPDAVGGVVGGAIFTAVALALFFGVDWGLFWPITLIVLGVLILGRDYWPRS